jgi:hypothetical protein
MSQRPKREEECHANWNGVHSRLPHFPLEWNLTVYAFEIVEEPQRDPVVQ